MGDLLETVLEAHGGLERWNQLDAVSVHGVNGGALWGLKGQAGVIDDVFVRASLEIAGSNPAAHYLSGYTEAAGVMVPTAHRILPRAADGQALSEPLLVSIDMTEVAFT
jgi:hypothetical protein